MDIVVQNCHLLRKERELPDWLNGTPILARDDGSPPLRGREALQHLRALLKEQPNVPVATEEEEHVSSPQTRSLPARSRAPPPPPRAPPPRAPPPRAPSEQAQFTPIASASAAFGEEETENVPLFDAEGDDAGNARIGSGKISDEDLQKYMNARNQSPASAAPEAQAT
jgi:hypothetical protein